MGYTGGAYQIASRDANLKGNDVEVSPDVDFADVTVTIGARLPGLTSLVP